MAGESLVVWRLVKRKYASSAYTGEGARRYGGRWNSRGIPLVYTAGSLSLAALELLVHLEDEALFDHYEGIPLTIPSGVSIGSLSGSDLPPDWRDDHAPPTTRALGDRWIESGRSAVLEVPSAVVPQEKNYLVNTAHPEWERLRVGEPCAFRFDPRLGG